MALLTGGPVGMLASVLVGVVFCCPWSGLVWVSVVFFFLVGAWC